MMHVVLVAPEIPQNTGNIARSCAATGSQLHLIRPLGFEISDRYLKRAGLDYWPMVKVRVYDGLDEFYAEHGSAAMFYATTKAPRSYCDVAYPPDAFLVFGCETKGLPESLLTRVYERCVRIPMIAEARSLNLANSVAVVLYEALRQQGFAGLMGQGALTGRDEPEPGAWVDYV